VVDDFRPDIIMTTTYSLKIADEILKVSGQARLVMESHETCSTVMKAYDYRSRPLMRLVAQRYDRHYYQIVNHFDQLVTLTAGDAAEWQRHIKISVSIIPNPLMHYPSTLSDKSSTVYHFISVGRLERVKGFDRLIIAFARIADQCKDWCLDIYGHGSEEGALRALIAQHGLEQRIVIHQPTSHIYEAYLQSDCYVLSSRHEGFGMVLLEAMACGLPCVAFDCPYGPGEVIKNGETGWLVSNDDVEQLAERLLWVATHDAERRKIGQTARQQVLKYANDVVMQQWVNLFNSWS
jgi:glycosyltransferase involved in cell wall biosynthesis